MNVKPLDTTYEGWQVQRAALDRMSGEARVRVAIELSEAVRALRLDGIMARHPHWKRAQAVELLIAEDAGVRSRH